MDKKSAETFPVMRYVTFFVVFVVLVSIVFAAGCRESVKTGVLPADSVSETKPAASASDDEFDGRKIEKTEDEWRAVLSPEQFRILREEGTEPPFSGHYNKNKEDGLYHCAACNLKLFSSGTKFESGTGWPSFYQPVSAKHVVEIEDRSYGVVRTEVECARCGSHLGHVFDDGPEPTGLRYCINSLALRFERVRNDGT